MPKEMKRPTSHISGNSIKPALSKAVEFYTDNNRQAYECIHERDEYIDYLESQLNNAKPQQALPVVPECVAEWIEHCKGMGYSLIGALTFKLSSTMHEELSAKILKWLENEGNDETFALAFITGKFTVEKPQLFYLKNKLTTSYLELDKTNDYFHHTMNPAPYYDMTRKSQFTQEEIDSMETGSYEQIEVAE